MVYEKTHSLKTDSSEYIAAPMPSSVMTDDRLFRYVRMCRTFVHLYLYLRVMVTQTKRVSPSPQSVLLSFLAHFYSLLDLLYRIPANASS